jgi:hypothetical protein
VFTEYNHGKEPKEEKIAKLIWRLNLKISGCIFEGKRLGWMFFFSQTEDVKQLMRLDWFVGKILKKHGLEDRRAEVKKFAKTYYEIVFNLDGTKYIIKFENFELQNKVQTLATLTGRDIAELSAMDVKVLNDLFDREIAKETRDLEEDLIEAFS